MTRVSPERADGLPRGPDVGRAGAVEALLGAPRVEALGPRLVRRRLVLVQRVEVERGEVREASDDPLEHVERGDDVDVGGVQVPGLDHLVVAAEVDELALAPAQPVLRAVEHERVDHGACVAAQAVGQGLEAVPPQLRVEQAQVERGVVGDDGDATAQGLGQVGGDLLQRLARRATVRAGVLGADAVDGGGRVRDGDAGVDQPAADVGAGRRRDGRGLR